LVLGILSGLDLTLTLNRAGTHTHTHKLEDLKAIDYRRNLGVKKYSA